MTPSQRRIQNMEKGHRLGTRDGIRGIWDTDTGRHAWPGMDDGYRRAFLGAIDDVRRADLEQSLLGKSPDGRQRLYLVDGVEVFAWHDGARWTATGPNFAEAGRLFDALRRAGSRAAPGMERWFTIDSERRTALKSGCLPVQTRDHKIELIADVCTGCGRREGVDAPGPLVDLAIPRGRRQLCQACRALQALR
jgi:hypothetical protein